MTESTVDFTVSVQPRGRSWSIQRRGSSIAVSCYSRPAGSESQGGKKIPILRDRSSGKKQATGSYDGALSAASSRASQVFGAIIDTEANTTVPVRDNSAGTHTLTVTDAGTFSEAGGEFATGGFSSTREGHATVEQVFEDKSTSFAGHAGLIDWLPPEEDEEPEPLPILVGAGGSASLTKSTYRRTLTEEFSYEETDGQLSRAGTVEDVTERTSESIDALIGKLADQADYSARDDGGWLATDSFTGDFTDDASGYRAAGQLSGSQQHHTASRRGYNTQQNDAGEQSHSSSTSTSKSRREGTSEGAVQIDPQGNVTGPSSFTGNDLSRVENQGNSFAQRQSSSTDGGLTTKTITVEGGGGNSRGEVTGDSSGTAHRGGSLSDSTTADVSAQTNGNSGGGGFAVITTTRDNPAAGTNETERVVSTGHERGKSGGSTSGTVVSGGGGAGMDLDFSGQQAAGGGQQTTRTLTSAAPGSRTRTTVTRSDNGTGDTHTSGTLLREGGQTEQEGTLGGNSDSTATVSYAHHGNAVQAGKRTYETATGTIVGGVELHYDGQFAAVGIQSFERIQADATRTSQEDSTSTTGSSEIGADNGYLFYKGDKTTVTIKADGKTTGSVEIENGQVQEQESGGGSQGSGGNTGGTETITVTTWDYRAKDENDYSRLDTKNTITTTSHTGVDDQGNATANQSIVEETTKDYFEWLYREIEFEEVNGVDAWRAETETHTIEETSRNSQTTTLSGPEGARKETLAIDAFFESLDEDVERSSHYVDPAFWGPDSWETYEQLDVTREEQMRVSTYRSSHSTDAVGLAYGGQFSFSGGEWTTITEQMARLEYGSGPQDGQVFDEFTWQVREWDDRVSQIDVTFNESGSYFDRALSSSGAQRVQQGNYQRTEDARDVWDNGYSDEYKGTGYGTYGYTGVTAWSGMQQETGFDERHVSTRGTYDEHQHEETRRASSDYQKLELTSGAGNQSSPQAPDFWYWARTRKETTIHVPEEGEPSGKVDTQPTLWSDNYHETISPGTWWYPATSPPLPANQYYESPPVYDPVTGPSTKSQPVYQQAEPPGVVAAFWRGLQYGVLKTGQALTFGLVKNDAAADELARYTLTDRDRAAADAWANRAAAATHAAVGGALIGRGVAAVAGSRAGAWAAGTRAGQLAARPAVQAGLGAASQSANALDAAKDVTQSAAAFGRGDIASGLGHAFDLLDNISPSSKGFAQPKSWKLKIHGTAHSTGTDGHKFRTLREAIKDAKNPDVARVHLNHGYNRALDLPPKTIGPNRRPDVTTIYKDGRVGRTEVQSLSDRAQDLINRNTALNDQIRAQGFRPLEPQVVVPTTSP